MRLQFSLCDALRFAHLRQGSLFGNPQGGNPYAQQYGQPAPQQYQQQHGGFQGNYGGQSHEDLFNPRVGQPAAAASAPAPAQGNPYGAAASSQYSAQPPSNPCTPVPMSAIHADADAAPPRSRRLDERTVGAALR